MTCIVGFTDPKNNCVWLGADSLGSNGWTQDIESNPKIFRHDLLNNVIMGSTTSFRHIDLLRYSDTLFLEIDQYKKPEINHRYMVQTFIPRLIALFQNNISENGTNKGANFLIGVDDKLFEVQPDYSVLQPTSGFAAVGSGEQVAMGSLITTTSHCPKLKPSEHVLYALEAAEKHCCGVQRPFYIINTKNEEVICIN